MVFFVGLVIDLVMGGCNGVFCYKELAVVTAARNVKYEFITNYRSICLTP
jgi:hypothetical protein